MGFGLLFLGYFVAYLMSLNPFSAIFYIVGYGIMSCGLSKLNRYHTSFYAPAICSIALAVLSFFVGVMELSDFLYQNMILSVKIFPAVLFTVFEIAQSCLIFLFHAFLLWAIRAIAKDTGVEKIPTNAIRNFVFILLSYIVNLVARLPSWDAEMRSYFNLFYVLLFLTWILLDLLLIYACYAQICDEDEREYQRKTSRFGFVNRFWKEYDRRQARAEEEDRAFFAERKKRKHNPKK